jgi:hypothetical protein
MSKPLPPPGLDGRPYNVLIKQGQTVVLHNGIKVILRTVATIDTRYFTAWQSIVGTVAEVDAQIAKLKLA